MLRGRRILNVVLVAVAAALVLGVMTVYAQGGPGGQGQPPCDFGQMMGGMMGQTGPGGMMGQGGMMGGNWPEDCADVGAYGWGMMGGMMGRMGNGGMMGPMMGPGGMMSGSDWMGRFGPGGSMMGAWTPPSDLAPAGNALTLEEATAIGEAYLLAWESNTPLELGEVMQFSNQFYGQAIEMETGRGAFEFLIDPATGIVYGEHGPNMMWNLRYGSLGRGMGMWNPPADADGEGMPISVEQARENAQAYLDEALPGAQVSENATAFYGYYTLDVTQDGETTGMLSVNGYTGQVWLHHWHGDFVTEVE